MSGQIPAHVTHHFTVLIIFFYIFFNLSIAWKCLLKHDSFSHKEGKYSLPFTSSSASLVRTCSTTSDHLMALSTKRCDPPPPRFLSLFSLPSSVPTKWMTAFRNTRVRHDSEVCTLCHLCSTCFDASAAAEAEENHAHDSTSSQLMLQPGAESRLITPL